MLTVTSKKFKSLDFSPAEEGSPYLIGCALDSIHVVVDFYFEKKALYKRLKFDSESKTISNYNNIDFDSFVTLGFLVGEKIKVVHSGGNNQDELTITAVEDRVITVSEALTDEITKSGSIYVTSDVTDLDYLYNVTPNASSARVREPLTQAWGPKNPDGKRQINTFGSFTDAGIMQKYTATALNCEDLATHKVFSAGTDSYAWVTDLNSSDISASYIVGAGRDGYKQKFQIHHFFIIAPYFLAEYYSYFKAQTIPPDFLLSGLGYQFQINAKYDAVTAGDWYFTSQETGLGCWYDQTPSGKRVEYTMDSIVIKDNADDSALDRIDFTKICKVDITIRSANALFTTETKFLLHNLLCPLDPATYQNTRSNMNENYDKDFAITSQGAGRVNGADYGTDYQALKEYTVTILDDSTAKLSFKVDYAAQMKTKLAAKDDSDRGYCFVVTTQKHNLLVSTGIDRVAVRCGFDNMDQTKTEAGLLELVDYIRCYHYPDMAINPKNNVKGIEGLPVYCEVPFRVITSDDVLTPQLTKCGIQIVAVNTGKQDFVLEEKIFQFEGLCNYQNAQQINIEESRGYKLPEGDPYNIASIKRATQFDSGPASEKKGFLFHYGFVIRYEDWISLLSPSSNCPDIQNDNPNLTQRWADIGNGWSLKLRFIAGIKGATDFETIYQAETTVTPVKEGTAPDAGPVYTPSEIYFLDKDNVRQDSILQGGLTKVVALFKTKSLSAEFEIGPTSMGVTHYEFTLPNTNIVPGSLRVTSSEIFYDDGQGNLLGDKGGVGTIDYDTGEGVLDYDTAPDYPGDINSQFDYYPTLTSQSIAAMIYADIKTASGGIAGRRFASSDILSEEDSPWSAPPADPNAISSWANGNLRIDVYSASSFGVSGYYQDSPSNFGNARCGFPIIHIVINLPTEFHRLWNDGTRHLWDDLSPAAFN